MGFPVSIFLSISTASPILYFFLGFISESNLFLWPPINEEIVLCLTAGMGSYVKAYVSLELVLMWKGLGSDRVGVVTSGCGLVFTVPLLSILLFLMSYLHFISISLSLPAIIHFSYFQHFVYGILLFYFMNYFFYLKDCTNMCRI